MLINLYPLKDVAVLYTVANFRNTNLIESSLCLKLFSESSSQFGENLETLVTRPLLSHSYVSLPHVLPRALFWATLFISLLHLSVTLPSLVDSPRACAHPLSHLQITWLAPFHLQDTLRYLSPLGRLLSCRSFSSFRSRTALKLDGGTFFYSVL